MDFLEKVFDHHKAECEKHGSMEEGDEFAYVLNDAVVVISLNDGQLKVNVILGTPERVDITTGMLEE